MKQWMNDLREEHLFTEMNKNEILRQLKESCEKVYETKYAHGS